MDDCIFCKIISREVPSVPLFEDVNTYAFLNNAPDSTGHALVIPKKHMRNFFDADPEALRATMETSRRIAPAIREGVGAEGMRIIINNEPAGGQKVFHLHVHLIPFFDADPVTFEPRSEVSLEERERVAERIKRALSL
ncbi:MAG: HIT domain-containing protein [Patescibacteria group bacterium]